MELIQYYLIESIKIIFLFTGVMIAGMGSSFLAFEFFKAFKNRIRGDEDDRFID